MLSEKLQEEFNERESFLKHEFEQRLKEIKQKYTDELSVSRNDLVLKYKKENGLSVSCLHTSCEQFILKVVVISSTELQFEKMKQEKEEAQQDLERMYKRKLIDADVRLR